MTAEPLTDVELANIADYPLKRDVPRLLAYIAALRARAEDAERERDALVKLVR
jgi:hypothetical protein